MQPETAAEAKAWFMKAANDLCGAEIDLVATPPLIEDALFLFPPCPIYHKPVLDLFLEIGRLHCPSAKTSMGR